MMLRRATCLSLLISVALATAAHAVTVGREQDITDLKLGQRVQVDDAAQQRLAQIAVLDGSNGVIMQAAADLLGMLPAPEHPRRTLTDELAAGIR